MDENKPFKRKGVYLLTIYLTQTKVLQKDVNYVKIRILTTPSKTKQFCGGEANMISDRI